MYTEKLLNVELFDWDGWGLFIGGYFSILWSKMEV